MENTIYVILHNFYIRHDYIRDYNINISAVTDFSYTGLKCKTKENSKGVVFKKY